GLFPFLVLGTLIAAWFLARPQWIIPGFIALVWTSIEQAFFGGLPSPIETGGLILLIVAAYFAVQHFGYAKEVLVVCALLAVPLFASGLASPDGMALPIDRAKNLTFLFLVALCLRNLADMERTAITLAG